MARLLFFGKLADVAGEREKDVDLPDDVKTITKLIDYIGEEDASLGHALKDDLVRYIVNEAMVSAETEISNHCEIAFLPPVSGG